MMTTLVIIRSIEIEPEIGIVLIPWNNLIFIESGVTAKLVVIEKNIIVANTIKNIKSIILNCFNLIKNNGIIMLAIMTMMQTIWNEIL